MTLRAAAAAASSGGRPAAAPDIIPGRARAASGAGALELALSALRNGIATGRYALGRRLVEAELITDLNVGRSTVREALRRLAGEGLVEIVRHRGAVVRRLTRRDVANLMLIRQTLEATSARLAAERIGVADHRPRLIAAIEHLRQAADPIDANVYAQGDHDLHHLIAQIGGNSQLEAILVRIWNALAAVQFWHHLPFPIYQVSMTGHEAVVKAILAGNGPAAARAMRRHLSGAAAVIGSMQDDRFAAEGPAETR
jgi:DNA-binding GntR family transcriptional regulator